jgi:maleate cis-trans isomerase
MYGWRGKIGVVFPTHRGISIEDWFRILPSGVGLMPAIIGFKQAASSEFGHGIDVAEGLAKDLAKVGVDVIAIEGLPPFALKGLEFEKKWAKRLENSINLPVLTPIRTDIEALRAAKITKVVVATYFGSELNERIRDFLESSSIHVLEIEGYPFGEKDKGMWSVPFNRVDSIGWTDVYRFSRGLFRRAKSANGIFIVGGGWDYASAIQPLESDLDTCVVSAGTASIWRALREIKVKERVSGFGKLFSL